MLPKKPADTARSTQGLCFYKSYNHVSRNSRKDTAPRFRVNKVELFLDDGDDRRFVDYNFSRVKSSLLGLSCEVSQLHHRTGTKTP